MNEDTKRYFAAANSRRGFVSFFEEVFFDAAIERRYVIKGGPGTGKSSFMKRTALFAEGKGMDVEYYYCSSDTNSLDGIVIDGRIAIFDGTAPHSYDIVLPGACDEIINLGAFWDAEALGRAANELRILGEKKRRAYADAYGYLRAAGELGDTLDGVISTCINKQKLKAAAERQLAKLNLKKNSNGRTYTRQIDAFGVLGSMHFDTLSRKASNKYCIDDYYGTAYVYMRELYELARRNGVDVLVSWDTVDTRKPKEIYFCDTGDYFAIYNPKNISNGHISQINMKRFIDAQALSNVRYAYRAAKQAYDALLSLALDSLAKAGKIHGDIEKIYVLAMDFDSLGEYCRSFCERIK